MKILRAMCLAALMSASLIPALLSMGCNRGYIDTAELERDQRGPTACAARCGELGMRMGALVLVSNSTPACVCEPIDPRMDGSATSGGAGAATGHVAIAAAAASAQQRQQQQQASATR